MSSCSRCGNPHIVIKRKHSGQSLCKNCFIKSVHEKVLKNIRKYNLIEKDDKVLIALSGGKDSVMALNIMNSLKERNIIDLYAVTIDEGIKGYRREGIRIAKENAQLLGVEHKIASFKEYFGLTLDDMMGEKSKEIQHRNACTYCGVFRRWILNQVAKEKEATKIATGHNLDDETQSILMNYLEGNINNLVRIGPKSESKDRRFTIKIKPLAEIPEREVELYAEVSNLKVHLAGCPYKGDSFRWEIGRFIKEISIKHPTIMYSTLRGFEKIKPIIKEEFDLKKSIGICGRCGEPAAGDMCKACTFLEELA